MPQSFTVLMSVYHGENPEYLVSSLESMTYQSRPASQIVIVQDGPISKDLNGIIDYYRDELPIISPALPQNRGLGAALNFGLSFCDHPFVARADTDDISFPDRFERQLRYFDEKPDTDVLGAYLVEISPDGEEGRTRTAPTLHEDILRTLWACPMLHPTVMFRTDRVKEVGGYSALVPRGEDYELWFRCARAGLRFAAIPEPLVYYRFSSDNIAGRQKFRDVWKRSVVGARNVRLMGLPIWQQLACFAPAARTLLPKSVQMTAYRLQERLDPRRKS